MLKVAQWNYKRNNTKFDPELETRMLAEEAQEFKDGMVQFMALEGQDEVGEVGEVEIIAAIVEMVDAWADYQFVMQGSIFKYLGYDTKFDWDSIRTQERYMFNVLTKDCEIPAEVLDICLEAVIEANNAKGTKKVDGKIQKGYDWRDPKDTIRGILNEL